VDGKAKVSSSEFNNDWRIANILVTTFLPLTIRITASVFSDKELSIDRAIKTNVFLIPIVTTTRLLSAS